MPGFTWRCAGAAVVISIAAARAEVIFVDAGNCPGPGDGTPGNPYCSIQAAIDAAADADEIVVAPGTYYEWINLLGKAVTLRTSDGPETTIIDAGGAHSVVLCFNGEGRDTVLDGFTITGGNTPGGGGGMVNSGTSPTVIDCVFAGNVAAIDGGGMRNVLGGSPLVINCTFADNVGLGGGMYSYVSSPVVVDCTFDGNIGGGIMSSDGSLTLTRCSFTGNTSDLGAGVFLGGGSPTLLDCTFSSNSAEFRGGALYNLGADPVLVNCAFTGNVAGIEGGAVWSFSSTATMVNCTLGRNTAGTSGGGMYSLGGGPAIANSIFRENAPDQIFDDTLPVTTASFSSVQGGWPGAGNIDADPLFVDPDNGDYRLSPGSSCIDAGDDTAVPDSVLRDLDGNPRVVADACSGDRGPVVDMGAYEFQGTSCDLGTMMALLAAWGPCPDCGSCPQDLDGDCAVGIADLLILLANWT